VFVVERSEELKSVMLRLYDAYSSRDAEAIAHRFSPAPGMLAIGTDPAEWWTGHDELVEVFQAQIEEVGGWRWSPGEIEAWCEGTVGWAADRPTITLGGQVIQCRSTAVLHLEHGEWKVVQWHLSLGIPNEEALGIRLTMSVDAVAEAAVAERPDLSDASSPEGTVTILFTDIEDSTVLTERMGDLGWMKLLGEHNELIREQVQSNSGFVVKTQGDGFMLAFASARRALHCATGIQQAVSGLKADGGASVRVRIGLHTGEVVKNEDDFFGKSVILASRIAGIARGGQVLVSGLVRDLTESSGEFAFGEARELELKGLSGTHRVFELVGERVRR
jgi:class 3 adenylate cyclase